MVGDPHRDLGLATPVGETKHPAGVQPHRARQRRLGDFSERSPADASGLNMPQCPRYVQSSAYGICWALTAS
jgi:hypothetical protein